MPTGRPSSYSEEIADEICNRLALGESLIQMCKDEHLPSRETVRTWIIAFPSFSAKYARAREEQQEHHAEEILAIADDSSNDWMDREMDNGRIERVVDHENIQRARLRVDTRKWIMSKLAPKKYGEKITQEHTGPEGGPAILQVVSKEPQK